MILLNDRSLTWQLIFTSWGYLLKIKSQSWPQFLPFYFALLNINFIQKKQFQKNRKKKCSIAFIYFTILENKDRNPCFFPLQRVICVTFIYNLKNQPFWIKSGEFIWRQNVLNAFFFIKVLKMNNEKFIYWKFIYLKNSFSTPKTSAESWLNFVSFSLFTFFFISLHYLCE